MDLNTTAHAIVQQATDEESRDEVERRKSASRAGKIGGRARANALSPKRRREIAMKANQARWADAQDVP